MRLLKIELPENSWYVMAEFATKEERNKAAIAVVSSLNLQHAAKVTFYDKITGREVGNPDQ